MEWLLSDELRAEVAGNDAERSALYRLFRKGMLLESDLESQLGELRVEKVALAARLEKVEGEVEKARDARAALEGARSILSALKSKVESDDSWAKTRWVIEALVAGVEIETLAKGKQIRGRGRAVTLKVSYRFETPKLGDVAPVSALLGLSIERVHCGVDFAFDQFACARDAARELLKFNPKMKAKEVIALVFEETGESISPASSSRLRHSLKQGNAKVRDG